MFFVFDFEELIFMCYLYQNNRVIDMQLIFSWILKNQLEPARPVVN